MQTRKTLVGLILLAFFAAIVVPLIGAGENTAPPASAATTPVTSATAPRRVKVLFLGDDGHHKPLDRARQAEIPMALRGVDLTYVDDLSLINPQNLARYDVLMLYANIEKAPPAAEKAIADYVNNGGGYAVIHCGSYCFLDSPELTAIAGGRFKRHGTGVFRETHAAVDHPILRGLKEIESWDESYVHEMHNDKDRTVLSYRVDKEGKEPYTWVRSQGKGRVFYTAWGHDERTWGNVDFQNLLERGLRWSAGDWALQPPPEFKPFEYGEGKAPNYLPSKTWGAAGDLITRIQKPLEAAESVKHMVLPPGFEARLFASDPQIYKPITMAWDERGRLWIAETIDYPNNLQNRGEGHDRISIAEDTDGDGIADKFTVFADKLSIPTSICFANGGILVAQAPDMLFLKDTKGDGKADVRKTLFTGWGTRDTHAGPSNLHWGYDNWIYGTVGYSGFNGVVGGEKLTFGQGIWRMKPDGSKLEFLGSTTNNTWGLGVSEDGNVFASTANGAPSFYLHIPNRSYETVRGLNVKRLEPISDINKFFPVTDKVRQVDFHGGYTAASGQAIYGARTWPSYYWNRVAFVTEPTGHLIGQFLLEPKGSAFAARNDFSLFGSTDEWTAPICAEVGPDGQVWMIDWYNFIVQHNPIPKGFEPGKGGAYETDLRDKTHGRIYRIAYKDGKPSRAFNLTGADTATLISALKSDNLFWRMHAQRLLVEKADPSALPALAKLIADPAVDAIGLNPAAIHALWTLQGLGLLDGKNTDAMAAAVGALKHPCAAVRKAAADVIPRTDAGLAAILAGKLLQDGDAQVRKSALLAISEMPAAGDDAGKAVYATLALPANANDRWITDAAAIAGARHDAAFLKAALASFKAPEGKPAATTTPVNLMPNPSFEETAGNQPKGWQVRHYNGVASQTLSTTISHSGKNSLMIRSEKGADSSWFADVECQPNTDYILSAWIKTENVERTTGLGILLNIHGTDIKTNAIFGTDNWRKVQARFNSGQNTRLSINCLYGGYGHATGTAYFDDIDLIAAGDLGTQLPGATGKVVATVITHYAQRAPKESVLATLSSLKSASPAMATLMVDALATSWPEGKAAAPQLTDADGVELQAVLMALPPPAKDRLVALVSRWGRADLLGEAVAAAAKELRSILNDSQAALPARTDAARRLIAMADGEETVTTIMRLINPKTGPDVQTSLLNALAESRSPAVGDQLMTGWAKLTPTTAKTALAILLRREAWTRSLLGGVKRGVVNPKDLLPQQWQAMTSQPDAEIAAMAKDLQKSSGQSVNADRQAIVNKLMPLAQKAGDAPKGLAVFQKNCAVCHTIEGAGGKVGPELTGVGARPKTDIIIDIVDPNRSVEGTYRQWVARTDDDVISGRLLAESQTSIEIIDAAGVVHPIQRNQLKGLTSSNLSVMPEGFEQLPAEDLTNLLEYLSTSKVKH